MGPLGPNDFYTKGVQSSLESAGVPVATIDITRGDHVVDQIASILKVGKDIKSLILLGMGSGDSPYEDKFINNQDFRQELDTWVKAGGAFIVQGERTATSGGNWPSWFGKDWRDTEYRRTVHTCFAKSSNDPHWCQWYRNGKGAVLDRISVKACMLDNVEPEDCLFGTTADSVSQSLVPFMAGDSIGEGLCAVAFARYGDGTVSFFGDVNAEADTVKIMAVVARGDTE